MLAQSNRTCVHCALCIVSKLLGCTFVVQSSTPPLFAQMVRHGRKKRAAASTLDASPTPPDSDTSPPPSSRQITLLSAWPGWGMLRAVVDQCAKRRGRWRRRFADEMMLRALRNDLISAKIADFLRLSKSKLAAFEYFLAGATIQTMTKIEGNKDERVAKATDWVPQIGPDTFILYGCSEEQGCGIYPLHANHWYRMSNIRGADGCYEKDGFWVCAHCTRRYRSKHTAHKRLFFTRRLNHGWVGEKFT